VKVNSTILTSWQICFFTHPRPASEIWTREGNFGLPDKEANSLERALALFAWIVTGSEKTQYCSACATAMLPFRPDSPGPGMGARRPRCRGTTPVRLRLTCAVSPAFPGQAEEPEDVPGFKRLDQNVVSAQIDHLRPETMAHGLITHNQQWRMSQ
jgi:hypothetical protein